MLVLQSFGPAFGEPSASPFCTKVLAMLSATSLEWEPDYSADVRKAPMQKLPVLLDGSDVIPDSSAIRARIEALSGVDFDEGLNDSERAHAYAVSRMAEEHLYFAVVYNRWVLEGNWQALKARFFGPVPLPLRGIVSKMVRKGVVANVTGQGMGRFDEAGVAERAGQDIKAIATMLGGSPFLFGDRITSADYSVAPILSSLANLPTEGLLRANVRGDAKIMGYVERCRAEMYSPFDQTGGLGRAA